jgi:hypothetical protein
LLKSVLRNHAHPQTQTAFTAAKRRDYSAKMNGVNENSLPRHSNRHARSRESNNVRNGDPRKEDAQWDRNQSPGTIASGDDFVSPTGTRSELQAAR